MQSNVHRIETTEYPDQLFTTHYRPPIRPRLIYGSRIRTKSPVNCQRPHSPFNMPTGHRGMESSRTQSRYIVHGFQKRRTFLTRDWSLFRNVVCWLFAWHCFLDLRFFD